MKQILLWHYGETVLDKKESEIKIICGETISEGIAVQISNKHQN
jgi:hypothetical protein